ncbi:hypothetical protein D4R99_03210 [bacterium]|nr:MAG: hypothetical protein D4R99_03210 [bacterium]
MAKYKEVITLIDESRELSAIQIGEAIDLTALESVTDTSSRRQKDAAKGQLIELKKRILDIQFNNLERETKLRKATAELKKHPTIMACAALRKEILKDRKIIDGLMNVYMGALNMTQRVGIKLDAKTLKELKEVTR